MTDFAAAQHVLVRELLAYKERKPRTNLLKFVWVLVHETSPEYAAAVTNKPIAKVDGFVLVRGGIRSGWADKFPVGSIATMVSIGDTQKAFPFQAPTEKLDGMVALDLLEAIFDGAPESEKPSILRAQEDE